MSTTAVIVRKRSSAIKAIKSPATNKRLTAEKKASSVLSYSHKKGVNDFVVVVKKAAPMQIIETERAGVSAEFLTDLAGRMDIPYIALAQRLGISKATASRKSLANSNVDGTAVIGMVRLLTLAEEMVQDSTSPEAKNFDTLKWLGKWLEQSQPALGGRRPSEFLDTPTGISIVAKVLGGIQSGAYQ